ncbi:hypothetical protein [Phenylobacterium sp.]|uniref:hypothetical protein n=1 Tax=Phenylobacterium sp. TaxID=1871053 RepID=UPI00289B56D1|nr:hypothetical protein [Phenylobacterium sp.]
MHRLSLAACAVALAMPGWSHGQAAPPRAELLKAAESGRASALIAAIDDLAADRAQDRRTQGLAVYLWSGFGLPAVAISPNAWGALGACLAQGVAGACDGPGAAGKGQAMLAAMTGAEPLPKAAERLAATIGQAPQGAPRAMEAAVGFPLGRAADNVRALDLQLTAFAALAGPAPAKADCARLAAQVSGSQAIAPLTGRGFPAEAAEGFVLSSPANSAAIAEIRRSCPEAAGAFTKARIEPKLRAAVRHAPAEVCGARTRQAYLEPSPVTAGLMRDTPALQTRFATWDELQRISRLPVAQQPLALEQQLGETAAFGEVIASEAASAQVEGEVVALLAAACPNPAVERQVLAGIEAHRGRLATLAAASEGPRLCGLAARRLLHVDATAAVRAAFEGAREAPALGPASQAAQSACSGQPQVAQALAALPTTTRLLLARNHPACKQALVAVDAAGAGFDAAVKARDKAGANAALRSLQSAWKQPPTACPGMADDLTRMSVQTLDQAQGILARM